MFDFQSHAIEQSHVDISDPYQGELGNHETAPTLIDHLEMRYQQENGGCVMAEAIFASKHVEEFALVVGATIVTSVSTVISRLAEYFFMRHGPRNAGNWKTNQQQHNYL